ncbi:MAG: hypothetical protein CVV05_15745 [Gammaproteobacteria bacterium HGW-Gammaproteobacteria-1]|jgi:protein TonB|nr:MAG: hypothetical protein CVV05_15745 [Gammaproteobacteria bacterium HGW-Gammaproteobacteria-1]
MSGAARMHGTESHDGWRRHALPLFILFSATAHAALLVTWTAATPRAGTASSAAATTLAVVMAAPPAERTIPTAQETGSKNQPRRVHTERSQRLRAQPATAAVARAEPAPPAAPADAGRRTDSMNSMEPSPEGAESSRRRMEIDSDPNLNVAAAVERDAGSEAENISARVDLELTRHFHYPSIAVRRNWQGIVLLGFRIGINGDIEAVHIARSSGYALLDRAALGALGKIQRVALDHGPLRAALDLQLPVIYRLEES